MATRIYSTLFIQAESISLNAAYTVPDGMVAVIRDIALFFYNSPADTAFALTAPVVNVNFFYHLQIDPNEYVHQELRQVVGAGSTFHAVSSGANPVSVSISGYLLQAD